MPSASSEQHAASGLCAVQALAEVLCMPTRDPSMASDDTRARIIGGVLGLAEPLPVIGAQPPFLGERDYCLVNARSGLALLVDLMSPGQVWMPSFICEVMLRAVQNRGTRQRFYEVDHDLAMTSQDWLEDVREGDIIVLIDYFGFPADSSCAAAAKQQGAWILEDACHGLLSGIVGQLSDFVLFSPRKFLGVPDGGILRSVAGELWTMSSWSLRLPTGG